MWYALVFNAFTHLLLIFTRNAFHTYTVQFLNHKRCERGQARAVKQGSYRVQRADEAATVVLVCVERPRHNNWFTVRPLSRQKSVDLRTVLATMSSCVCTPLTGRKMKVHLDYIHQKITTKCILPSYSTLECLPRLQYELLYASAPHILFLSLCPHPVSVSPYFLSTSDL